MIAITENESQCVSETSAKQLKSNLMRATTQKGIEQHRLQNSLLQDWRIYSQVNNGELRQIKLYKATLAQLARHKKQVNRRKSHLRLDLRMRQERLNPYNSRSNRVQNQP